MEALQNKTFFWTCFHLNTFLTTAVRRSLMCVESWTEQVKPLPESLLTLSQCNNVWAPCGLSIKFRIINLSLTLLTNSLWLLCNTIKDNQENIIHKWCTGMFHLPHGHICSNLASPLKFNLLQTTPCGHWSSLCTYLIGTAGKSGLITKLHWWGVGVVPCYCRQDWNYKGAASAWCGSGLQQTTQICQCFSCKIRYFVSLLVR